jgi:Tfp pilus assembly protein PilO
MSTLPIGARGRVLAAGILVVVLGATWVGVLQPLRDYRSEQAARIEDLNVKAEREEALAATLPRLRAAAKEAASAPVHLILAQGSDATAGAALQERLRSMASAAGAILSSVETLPGEQVGPYRRIGVRVELNSGLPQVVALLRAVEEAQPFMVVDDLRLTTPQVLAGTPELPMDAAFTVLAYRVGTTKDTNR